MLLVFDIGNANIKTAIFDGDKLLHEWRISSDARRTGDEYFSIVSSLMNNVPINQNDIETVAVSSVVPPLIGPFVIVSQQLVNKKPLIIEPSIYSKLPVKIPEHAVYEIGADLLCDAVEAWLKFHEPVIVADFGTALSFTAIDNDANIAGVAIAPGIGTALKSLFNNTAQLPSVPLEIPPSSLGTNTIESIQSGILFGYKGLVEGMINKMKDDLSAKYHIDRNCIHTIATGGLNSMLSPICNIFDCQDKQLTINGLRHIVEIVVSK